MIMGRGWLPGGIGASVVGMMADNIGLARALATQVIPLLAGVLAVGGHALLSARRCARQPPLRPRVTGRSRAGPVCPSARQADLNARTK